MYFASTVINQPDGLGLFSRNMPLNWLKLLWTTREAAWYIISVVSACLYVCLSDDNFRKLWRTKFIYAHPMCILWRYTEVRKWTSYVKAFESYVRHTCMHACMHTYIQTDRQTDRYDRNYGEL